MCLIEVHANRVTGMAPAAFIRWPPATGSAAGLGIGTLRATEIGVPGPY